MKRAAFLRATASMDIARISYGNCLSVRPSVWVSRPGTVSKPDEIETLGFYLMTRLA